jgi:KDO2-lipid IV(A) lauroyltransferase
MPSRASSLAAPATPERAGSARYRLLGWAVRVLAAIVGALSWTGAQRLGQVVGRLGGTLLRRDRRRALDHLARAFPELSPAGRAALARGAFQHQAMNLTELLFVLRRGFGAAAPRVEVQGWEHVEAARAAGRPVLVVTGHCGNWELIGGAFTARGMPLTAVAREIPDPALRELMLTIRRPLGTATITRGGAAAARQLLEVFRRGGGLAMLIDQDTRVEGVWVPFFGRLAFTPVGAARIALRQRAAVLPIFDERRPDGTHLVRILPALDLPPDETAATALMTAAIENQVRRRPEQWVWWHKRWRRQPPAATPIGR